VFGTSPPASAEERAFNGRFRDRTVLFGDAAGAVVLARDDDPARGLIDIVLHADGKHVEKLYVPAGFKWRPYITEAMVREGRHIPEMDGPRVFRVAVTRLPEVVHEVLKRNRYKLDDVSLLLAHQANLRLNEAVQRALGLPDERVYNNIQRYGNTTAATLPLVFHEAKAEGRVRPGDLVAFAALGAGLHWGAALMRA
jgi:3-oxoacyl-[acyl-carrier-protein] synthase-3